jgi:hypothetical protein
VARVLGITAEIGWRARHTESGWPQAEQQVKVEPEVVDLIRGLAAFVSKQISVVRIDQVPGLAPWSRKSKWLQLG